MAYSKDIIERVVAYRQEGHTIKQLRDAFGIPSVIYYGWEEKLDCGYYDIRFKREYARAPGGNY
ncbi:MAG: transposase [Treponema sp.]|jgi:hypothetical protein|nr:transposase [Treponema sp.]